MQPFRAVALQFLAKFVLFSFAVAVLVTTSAHASEEKARALAERVFPGKKVDASRKLPDLPFFEIWIARNLVYTDLDAKVMILGDLMDSSNLSSLREARITELFSFKPEDLPLDTAVKTIRGNGASVIRVFADPNCAFCKQFEAELKTLTDVTIYTVLYPVLGPDSIKKSRNILCAANPESAWRAWVDAGTQPPDAPATCNPSFEKILAFGADRNIATTPTTIYANGFRMAGFTPAMTVRTLSARAHLAAKPK